MSCANALGAATRRSDEEMPSAREPDESGGTRAGQNVQVDRAMSRRSFFFMLTVAWCVFGCVTVVVDEVIMSAAIEQSREGINIRVRNDSAADFDRVVIVFPKQQEVDYGRLARGDVSQFRATAQAYRYAGVRVTIGQRELALNPIDYVGEQPLAPGRYTYVLGVEGDRLTLSLERVQ
jgi:hypothetical protein